MNPKEILRNYLKCERLLSMLFKQVDYCEKNCISQEKSRYGNVPGNIGCCDDSYHQTPHLVHDVYNLLIKEREAIYGEPGNEIKGECFYHTYHGCLLLTHKSPTCISFACGDLEEHMEKEYGIPYKTATIREIMTDIICGRKEEHQIEGFRNILLEFTHKVITCQIGAHEPYTPQSQIQDLPSQIQARTCL